MERHEQFLRMSDGQEVYVTTYVPVGEVRGHIHVLHGMAEHSGRYERYAFEMERFGYAVSMHDHRGHGQTASRGGMLGFFGHNKGFERVVQDVFEVTQHVRTGRDWPELILFGHSMGSFIARRYAQLFPTTLQALILSGTGAHTTLHVVGNRLANFLARTQGKDVPSEVMDRLSFGSFNKTILNPKTAYDWLTRDTRAVQRYIDDPMCGYISTNQFFADVTYGVGLVSRPREIARMCKNMPVLLISGSADPVGNFGRGVYKVGKQMQAAGMEHVCVHLFEEMRHEILNETNKEQVYQVIKRWLEHGRTL